MIDLHSHLDLYPNALALLDKVNNSNKFTLAVTTSPRAWQATSLVFKGYENIHTALGLHPEIVTQKKDELPLFIDLLKKTKFVGEVGIDYSVKLRDTYSLQNEIFDTIISECQKDMGKIISIHSRRAVKKVLESLKKYPNFGVPIFHWFSGSPTELKKLIEIKSYFSINELMIRNDRGKEIIKNIPKESILVESDGPFATIENKPIMPWETIRVYPVLSEIWKVPLAEVENQININLDNLLKFK